nr:hypothetical protein Iba_chr08dCG6780 [Ipomoea batatas]
MYLRIESIKGISRNGIPNTKREVLAGDEAAGAAASRGATLLFLGVIPAAFSTSSAVILPKGPVPATLLMSILCCFAIFFAYGVATILLGPSGAAAGGGGAAVTLGGGESVEGSPDRRADGSRLAVVNNNSRQNAIIKGLHIHIRFIRLNHHNRLAFGEHIALGLHPRDDLALGHGGAKRRHEDLADLRLNSGEAAAPHSGRERGGTEAAEGLSRGDGGRE